MSSRQMDGTAALGDRSRDQSRRSAFSRGHADRRACSLMLWAMGWEDQADRKARCGQHTGARHVTR